LKAKLLDNTEKNYITTINLQILILQNQHSGKDTHMRQIKIFGPKEKINQGLGFPDFTSPEITQYYSLK
jgi:anaphase-promoting complex subunit 10